MPALSSSRPRWGDQFDEDDVLPASVQKEDEHGMKTVIEYFRNEKGEAFKKSTKLKVVSVERKVYKVRFIRLRG
jgi:translation initiation factor 3 subunit G